MDKDRKKCKREDLLESLVNYHIIINVISGIFLFWLIFY